MKDFKTKKHFVMIIAFFCITFATTASAGEFTCNPEANTCTYKGKVTQIYVNPQTPLFMVYVDTLITVDEAVKGDVVIRSARRSIAVDDTNIELTKMVLSAIQVAFVANKEASILVKGAFKGYPKLFSAWVQ